ncbi:MAG: hypothetical protein IPI32_11215 [Austwickia sp.]|jgi:hypothetical protein|nr:hypothetical protein [Austwickia sp.]MBK8435949.1 hypothetical protein [Austwickia sp.]MBK9101633.1 hypothetical protein [Austwickia sp.]
MLMRPALAPHAALLIRTPDTVQIGMCPHTGIVLSGVTDQERTFLTMLDGSRDIATLRRWALRSRTNPVRVDEMLETLTARGLLHDGADADRVPQDRHTAIEHETVMAEAQSLRMRHRMPTYGPELVRQRAERAILIDGHGNLADAVAATLRQAGFRRLQAGSWAGAIADFRRRAGQESGPGRRDLVIVVAPHALDRSAVDQWQTAGPAVLPVITQGSTVDVGPLLGRSGPCANCLDLHRADRDPAWPQILAQLTAPRAQEPPPARCASAVAALAAGCAAVLVTDFMDVHRCPPGVGYAIQPRAPYLMQRRWVPHPRCACTTGALTMSS